MVELQNPRQSVFGLAGIFLLGGMLYEPRAVGRCIDDWGLGPLAAKEAAVMRLEPLGNVKVLRVKVEEDEQLGFVPDLGTRNRKER